MMRIARSGADPVNNVSASSELNATLLQKIIFCYTLVFVKHVVQIGSRLLTAYFVTFPILFGCHAFQYQHHSVKGQDGGLEFAQLTSDCALCDMYHSQSAIIETPFSYDVGLAGFAFQKCIAEDPAVTLCNFSYLRGPPAA